MNYEVIKRNNKVQLRCICEDCGETYYVLKDTVKRGMRNNPDYKFRCRECFKKFASEKMKERWKNVSPEYRAQFAENQSKRIRKFWDNITPESMKRIGNLHRQYMLKVWEEMGEEEKDIRLEKLNDGFQKWFATLTEDQKTKLADRLREKGY